MNKPTTYFGFCPWGHGVVTIKTTISPEYQRNYCMHCGSGLNVGDTKESFTLRRVNE